MLSLPKSAHDMQKAFDKMCLLMAANAITAYPDHKKHFLISILMHMIFNLAPPLYKKGGQLPTFLRSCQNHTTIAQ
jgi:hypothetical protein